MADLPRARDDRDVVTVGAAHVAACKPRYTGRFVGVVEGRKWSERVKRKISVFHVLLAVRLGFAFAKFDALFVLAFFAEVKALYRAVVAHYAGINDAFRAFCFKRS